MEFWIILILAIAFMAWRMKPVKGVQIISTHTLKGILNDKDRLFVDVRTAGEYKARNIPQFKNIPLGSDYQLFLKAKK